MLGFFSKKPEGEDEKGHRPPVDAQPPAGDQGPRPVKIRKVDVFHCRGCEKELEREHFFGGMHTVFWCDNRSCEEFGYMVMVGIKRGGIDWN